MTADEQRNKERKLQKELVIWAMRVVESDQFSRDEFGAVNASLAPNHDTEKESAPMADDQSTATPHFPIYDCPICGHAMVVASCWVQWNCGACRESLSWAVR